MERALRRCGIPVTYSEGFSPRLRMSFGLALPTCYESEAEYLDVPLNPDLVQDQTVFCTGWGQGEAHNPTELQDALNKALPNGFDVVALTIEPKGKGSLQEAVLSCGWSFDIVGAQTDGVQNAIETALNSSVIEVDRKKKNEIVREDIRHGIHELRLDGESERGPLVVAELSAKPRVIRPSELVDVLAPGAELGVAKRTHQWIETDGQRIEPLTPSNSITT
tara:strand:+ start:1167 stop:1829 length:663 start_codon:yes stop_codon:yes gene_type:complete